MKLTTLVVFLILSVAVLEAKRGKPRPKPGGKPKPAGKPKPKPKPAPSSCKGDDGKTYAVGKSYTKDCSTFTCTKVWKKIVMKEGVAEGCCRYEENLYPQGSSKVNDTEYPAKEMMCCGGEWTMVQDLSCCKWVEITSSGGARMEDMGADRETHGSIFGQYTKYSDVLTRTNQWRQDGGSYIMYYDSTWQSGGYWRVGLDTSTCLLRSLAPPSSCPNMASAWEYAEEYAGSHTKWYPDYTLRVQCATPGPFPDGCDQLNKEN